MASRWFAQKLDSPEPIAFRELVEKARAGELTEDDLVRAEWEADWHPARTVVGLFYTVRRSVSVGSEPELASAADRSELPANLSEPSGGQHSDFSISDLAAAENLETASEAPRWKQRLQQVRSEQPPPPEHAPSAVQILVEAAIAEREPKRRSVRLEAWSGRIRTASAFIQSPIAFRLVFAVTLAVLVCWGTARWARTNAMRFPNPRGRTDYKLPVLGDCPPTEFTILLVDLALLSALAGYFGAKRVEVWTDAR